MDCASTLSTGVVTIGSKFWLAVLFDLTRRTIPQIPNGIPYIMNISTMIWIMVDVVPNLLFFKLRIAGRASAIAYSPKMMLAKLNTRITSGLSFLGIINTWKVMIPIRQKNAKTSVNAEYIFSDIFMFLCAANGRYQLTQAFLPTKVIRSCELG